MLSPVFLESLGSVARRAHEVMSRPLISVSEDTGVDEIARLLIARRIKRVPVLRDGPVVGIVSAPTSWLR
jgi:CBS domain-containing protein